MNPTGTSSHRTASPTATASAKPGGRKYGGQSITTGPVVGDEHVPAQVAVDHLGRTVDRSEGRAQPVDLLEGHVGRNRVGVLPRDPVPLGPGIGALVEETRPVQGRRLQVERLARRPDQLWLPRHPGASAGDEAVGRPAVVHPRAVRRPKSAGHSDPGIVRPGVEDVADPRVLDRVVDRLEDDLAVGPGAFLAARKSAQRRRVGTECCDDVVGRDNHVDRLRAARQSESATQILTTVERYDR